MKDIHLHTVVLDYKNFEILSADTDFYAFIGLDRFFNTFDKLIYSFEDKEFFKKVVNEKNTEPFVISFVKENGETVPTYMRVKYERDNMSVILESLEELWEGQELYHNLSNVTKDLLGLHNDIIFVYSNKDESVKLFSQDFRRCIKEYSVNEFLDEIKSNIDEDEYSVLDEFTSSLSTRFGSFTYTFKGRIVEVCKECDKSIVKGIMVSDIESITTIGYIHRSIQKDAASYTVEMDALTGTYAKREISNIARKAIDVEKKNVAVCIMDIDYFKRVNDNFGHMRGDVVLKEVADIIKSEVGNSGVVGRFGGDEFLVVFYDVDDMNHYRGKLRSIRNRVSVKYSTNCEGTPLNITMSIGCAIYPRDAATYDDVFAMSDYCLYLAKDKGRNRYIIYEPDKHCSLEEIKSSFNNNRRIDNRKNLAMGDVLCMIGDKHYNDDSYTPEMLADDLVDNLFVERVVCLTGTPLKCRCMAGSNLASIEVINESAAALQADPDADLFKNDIIVINNIERLKDIYPNMYELYKAMHIKSCLLVRFYDAAGKFSLLTLEMSTTLVSWDETQDYNYRTMARMFAKFVL